MKTSATENLIIRGKQKKMLARWL